jgi:FixJ family two-component response regulator
VAHSRRPDMTAYSNERPVVAVVDDDESVRESLPDLLKELGYESMMFSSAEELLSSDSIHAASCAILDIGLPKMSGPDLQRELARRGHGAPVVFITGRAEKSIPPGLLPRGAEFLFKPFSEHALSAALDAALRRI